MKLVCFDADDAYQGTLDSDNTDYGFVVAHNGNPIGAGLLFNDGDPLTDPGSGSSGWAENIISMIPKSGIHSYKIVFSHSATELFQDGSLVGATTNYILDFTKSYKIIAYAQDIERQKSAQ